MSHTAMKEVIAYSWPGNIRELKNVVERAVILSGDKSEIRPEHLTFSSMHKTLQTGFELSFDHEPTLEEIEEHYLKFLLKKYSGHRKNVAETLGISERNTYRLLKKYGFSEDNMPELARTVSCREVLV
jgi:DNA-binding NtrC family response regulator